MNSPQFRQDLQGLRAIAVLPVVLFHAGFDFVPGGFVGVDIFFVISGYLITGILLKGFDRGTFSYSVFYLRRMRRLFPALLLVVSCSMLLGFWVLLPDELVSLAQSAVASLLFSANFFFWSETGYFAIEAQSTPLLHLWSLGVEEQYYLLFPAFIALIYRHPNKRLLFPALAISFLISLALSIVLVYYKPSATFYLLPTRAWELLGGAIIATGRLPKFSKPNAWGVIGLGLIGYALFYLHEGSVFPGVNAIAPVFGAALIIHAGSDGRSIVSRLLTNPLLVFVGTISYSLYLWHWPVAVYLRFFAPGAWTGFVIVLMSLALATLSHRFIEEPIRSNRVLKRNTSLSLATGLAGIFMIGACFSLVSNNGFPDRLKPETVLAADINTYAHEADECHFYQLEGIKSNEFCIFGEIDAEPSVALIGDSHAHALRPAVEIGMEGTSRAAIHLTYSGCRPLVGVYEPDTKRCAQFMEEVTRVISETPSIDTIFLAGFWIVSYSGFSDRNANNVFMDSESSGMDISKNPKVFARGLRRSIEALHSPGRRIYVVGDVPEVGVNARTTWARMVEAGSPIKDLFSAIVMA